MNIMKRQKDMTPEDEPLGWKFPNMLLGKKKMAIINTPRKNEEAGAKQKWHSAVDVSGGKSKISDAVKNNTA